MSQSTAEIHKLVDKDDEQFFPITHVDAVIDGSGNALSTLLSGKQATLVSGTNIKTINNESLLGSGNITIQGGGGGSGTVTSVAMTVPTGLSISGSPVTSSGTLAVSLASGYSIPTTSKQSEWDGKQAALVSGSNIKTINNESLLGSGNISISSGGGEENVIEVVKVNGTALTPDSNKAVNVQAVTAVTFNGTSASISSGTAAITATIPSAPGTLDSTATTAQSTNASEALSGSVKLHKVAKTGTYSDLIGTPSIPSAPGTLNTNNSTAQTASSSEALSGTIKLHKVSKTGTYSDLIGTPTIPSAPGTLNTTATTAQSTSSSEALSGTIKLHKVAKTGTYSDLISTPSSLPASDVYSWAKAATKPSYTLDEVSDGSTRKLANYLPLSGGTVTGEFKISRGSQSSIALNNTASGAEYASVVFQVGGTNYGAVRVDKTNSSLLYAPNAGNTVYTVYHSGNFTAGTNFQKPITISSSEPTSSDGSNGDIWIVI